MKKTTLLSLACMTACIFQSYAQISVTGGLTATQLANILAGSNIVVSGATLTGSGVASGTFDATGYTLGMNTGVILSTGNISSAPGPNSSPSTSNQLGTAGTAQMTALAGANTFDAITLEFDFNVQSDFIQFDYLFASEEYPEYAPPNNSSYNDVFAFFISGPGITGEENIAFVPGTTNPVTINNINAITNNQFYVDNAGGQAISFDGFTTLLTARKDNLIPCQNYHLKLVIADAGDSKYNSAVLLKENSLVQGVVEVTTNTVNADNIALEGCVQASFTFTLDQPSTIDKVINFQIAGTATNGVDYHSIAPSLTIPAGQTQAQVFIDAISDGFAEGQETIYLIYKPEICSGYDTAFLYIDDAQPILYTLTPTDLSCYNDHTGQILVTPSGGFPPYHYEVTDHDGIINNYSNNPITGLDAGTYSLMVYDAYGCKAKAIVIGGLFNAGTTFLPDGSGAVYTSTLNISGFNTGALLSNLNQLQNICLNMEHSYMGDLELRLIAPGGQNILLKSPYGGGSTDLGEPIATGPVDGSASSTLTDPGVGYDYCFNQSPMYGTMVSEANIHYRNYTDMQGHSYSDYYLPAGTYAPEGALSTLIGTPLNGNWTVQVTDHMSLDNGYIFNWTISFVGDLPDSIVTISEPAPVTVNHFTTNATCGSSNGAINISVNGNYPPFSYLWSNSAITEDISGIAAGAYTVTVTDSNSCETPASFSVSNNGTLSLSATVTPVTCHGNNTGSINITPAGGALPYTFLWSNALTTEDITTIPAGNYSVTVTDQNNCQLVRLFNVTTNPAINITQNNLQNEQCGTHNGSISITAGGGSGSFGYSWSNGDITPLTDELTAGTYTVTVSDANACTATQSFTIVNDVSNCIEFCYLDISGTSITDELCGNGNGAVDITVNNATAPYNVIWSTGATSEDLSGLHQGTYTVTVTDVNQCEKIKTFTVGNNTGNLSISSFNINNETCGTGNGTIDLTVSGGAQPYAYHWSNAATTEDLTDLTALQYTVSITDANHCSLIQHFTVINNAGNLLVTGVVNDEICSADNGSIVQTVSGGFGNKSYLWSNNSTQQSLLNIAAGNYTCNITDEGGCSVMQQYSVANLPGNLNISSTTVNNEICGNGLGSINLIVSGSNPLYHWNTGGTSASLTGLSAGTYSCTISNNSGCSVTTGPIYVFDASGTLSVTTNSIGDEICNNHHGNVTVNLTGGMAPVSFLWSNGSTSQNIYNLQAGNYSLTVTDSNGCQSFCNATVVNNPGTLSIQNAVVTNENCGNGNGAINLMVSGSTTPYSYHWSNGAITQDLSGLHANDYTVTVTSNEGCSQIHTSTVDNISNGMILNWQVTNEICSNGTGSIDLQVSGGTAPLTYAWADGPSTQDRTLLSAGIYVCTVTDNTNCHSVTDTIVVNNSAATMTALYVKTDETCGNSQGSINLSVTGGSPPLAYLWSTTAITEDLSGLAAGTYSYTVTDANNCLITGSVTVNNIPGTLSYSKIITDEHCNNNLGSINLTITGGSAPYGFTWNDGPITEDRTALSAGNYNCTVTDDNGCQLTTGNMIVSDNPGTLVISAMAVINEACDNNHGQINLSVTGGNDPYSYLWSTGAVTEDVLNLTSGTFSVTVTDSNGCAVLGQAVVANSTGSFGITDYNITDEHCSNGAGAIDIAVQGGTTPYTYVWSNGATVQDISSVTSGNYMVFVSDDAGCTANGTYVVSNNGSSFQIDQSVITDDVCGSGVGAIAITHSGGTAPFLYQWSHGASTEDLSHLHQGIYTVTITDVFGCQVAATYTINNAPGTMVLYGNAIHETCGDGLGSINLSVFGGGVPYEYLWNNGAQTQDLTNMHGGNYAVTVTDAFGCAGNFTAEITNNTGGFIAEIDTVTEESCGAHNGAVSLNVSGGQTPYVYDWSNGAITEDISGLAEGAYDVQVTDSLGCSYFLQANITNLTGGFEISFANVQDENCDNGDGFIDIDVTGGTLPYSYHWSNNATAQDITGLFQGNYSVTVTDDAGCNIIQSWHINNANTTNIQISGVVTDATCLGNTGSIDLTVTGGMSPMIFSWNQGSTVPDISNLAPGAYTIVISDDAGCSNHSTFNVYRDDNPDLGFAYLTINDDYCNTMSGYLYFEGTGGNTYEYYVNGQYSWTNYITDLSAGSYHIEVVDENGCTTDSTVVIANYVTFTTSTAYTNETCNQHNGAIDLTASIPGLSYQWNTGSTAEDLTGLDEGDYTCTITDGGCTEIVTVTLTDNFDFELSFTVSPDLCGDSTGAIDQVITGGGAMSYLWSNGDNTMNIGGLPAGNYSCTITNTTSGCIMTHNYVVLLITSGMSLFTTIMPDTCGQGVGSILNSVSGGSGDFSYQWSHGPTSLSLTGLYAGNYDLVITDNSDGCHINTDAEVANLSSFTSFGIVTNTSCAGCPDGQIDVDVHTLPGFSSSYTYEWSNASTTQDQWGLVAGNYCVTITAVTGCDTVMCFEVLEGSGIQDQQPIQDLISIYPNPAADYVIIEVRINNNEQTLLRITDIERRVILQKTISRSGLHEINTASLARGVYHIELISEKFNVSKKLIIMR